jgi:zinc transporter 2
MTAELVGGCLSSSLAIMTDAAHLLSDFAGFCISLFAIWVSSRPATKNMSFGYYRAEVIGAVLSVLLIWVLTGVLVYVAVLRCIHQDFTIDADIMLVTASCGVVVNIVLGLVLHQSGVPHSHGGHSHAHDHGHSEPESPLLPPREPVDEESQNLVADRRDYKTVDISHDHKHEAKNLNLRAAFIHAMGDLVQSIGVLIAAVVIKLNPDYIIADPICTFIFSILVLFTTLAILRDAMGILMEAKPDGYEYDRILGALQALNGVKAVHSLHVWSLSAEKVALSVHLAIDESVSQDDVLNMATNILKQKFHLYHTTIQVEKYMPHLMDDCTHCIGPQK